jgi:hypothetical protein
MSQPVKYYLAAYNAIAFLFWGAYFICFIASGFALSPLNLLLLNIAQGMAVLEILHTVFKWVKSPVGSTAAQVASRILVLVAINWFLSPAAPMVFRVGVLIVSFAWSITELVRYSFYFLGLFDIQPRPLLWMRYSFFIALYPLGVTGEWLILITPLVAAGLQLNLYNAFLIVLAASYLYYFPVLYKYMWKQRRSKL